MDRGAALHRIRHATGFIAALDQSGGSTPRALENYGIAKGSWTSDAEMFELVHQMRSRIVTSPAFGGDKILAAILFERTLETPVADQPITRLLDRKGIASFLKIDEGLADESNGVQAMKPITRLDHKFRLAHDHGVCGTKARSLILSANDRGIRAVVDQQFCLAAQVAGDGLIPIVEPEVSLKAPCREEAERMLLDTLAHALDDWRGNIPVVLKLSPPVVPDTYAGLVDHPKVARVAALSGGFDRARACRELAKNHGMIASFSRALLEDLRVSMSDTAFDAALARAIDEIHAASFTKTELGEVSA
ncbi:class I fructose-bisphosphate aldolase [Qipengyuania zhejiangensis]|uniref:class I fructose-bisphosphate aldolase n=1 Tax=Qipengyuania zhejiangensis TaxID=3077782 RepID=UPI002D77AF1A|nr:class I fructose-bisphosphate aldolase [Qipengyuania sp. Z2]